MTNPTATIHQADCLQLLKSLPANSVQAVLTDPPYCSGGFTEAAKQGAAGQGLRSERLQITGWFSNDNMTTQGLVWLLREVMVECERLLCDGGSAIVFTDWRMVTALAPALESTGLQFRNLLVWDKGQSGLGNGFRPQHELMLHLVKGKPIFYSKSGSNVLKTSRVHWQAKQHPTEKPTELLTQLLQVITQKGDVVLDPFFGSGSTGVAAIKAGRSVIGIGKTAIHYTTATERLAKAALEGTQLNLLQ